MEWLLLYIRNGFPFIRKWLNLQKQNSLQVYEKYINSKYSLNIRRLKFLAKFEIKYIYIFKLTFTLGEANKNEVTYVKDKMEVANASI